MLAWFFGVRLRWVPPSGFVPFAESPGAWARSLALPAVTLGVGVGSIMARFVQASLEDVLGKDYVRTARAKGLPPRGVILRHALRNALVPIITVFGIQAGFFIGGAVITEAVFAIPGLGTALWRSILTRDYLVTQSIILVSIVAFVVISLLTDVAYAVLDPTDPLREGGGWRFVSLVRRPSLSLGFLALLVLAAVAAPVLAPHDPTEMNKTATLALPSWSNLLGTDQFGRDILSRLLARRAHRAGHRARRDAGGGGRGRVAGPLGGLAGRRSWTGS